jgi:hypothetical protein
MATAEGDALGATGQVIRRGSDGATHSRERVVMMMSSRYDSAARCQVKGNRELCSKAPEVYPAEIPTAA